MPLCQYYAYIEIDERRWRPALSAARSKDLWRAYAELRRQRRNFAIERVAGRDDIYPVFRELFAKKTAKGAAQ